MFSIQQQTTIHILFQVAPAELEDILHKHPKISDAAVIGIPHERQGEAPRAYIVPIKENGKFVNIDLKEIVAMVKQHVAEHKYLTGGIEIVSEIPKSQTGKILRRQIKQDYLKRVSS
jgi:acyl-coenzyme A synthetase/AMP-(fatty) acid ligase